MRYVSTRNNKSSDDVISNSVTFEEALTSGYAKDGGLFVPEQLPKILPETLHEWIYGTVDKQNDDNSSVGNKIESYSQLMYTILRMFIDCTEISNDKLQEICQESVMGFDDPIHCIPVIPFYENQISDTTSSQETSTSPTATNHPSFYVAELFHGPTFCFKDLGMRTVIYLLYHFAQLRHRSITLLVSTTGDTGPAAAQTIHDINDPMMNIIVHYPHEQISQFQQQQLVATTVGCDHIDIVAFHGGGDDMDLPIKHLLSASKMKQSNNVVERNDVTSSEFPSSSSSSSLWTGVNSYNIGRPLTQIVLYIWTYICIARDQQWSFNDDDKTKQLPMIDIILPTGAMGNIVAGYMSRLMGVPIRTLVAAVNINDIMYQTINYGTFHKSARMERTLSEAINIQVPYNFERMIYYITNENDKVVREYYENLETTDQMTIPLEYLQKIQKIFQSARVTDTQMCDAIRYIHDTYNKYMIDPHTAVAFSAAFQLQYIHQHPQQESPVVPETIPTEPATFHQNHDSTTVILATASPCKFEHSVSTAVGATTWDTYLKSTAYPVQAKRILKMQSDTFASNNNESRIHYYTNPRNLPISEIQREWEDNTRKLIKRLETKNGV